MRTLEIHEMEEVSGGIAVQALVTAIKVGGVVVGGIIAATATYLTNREAARAAEELCKQGSDTSTKTPTMELKCTAPKPPARPVSAASQSSHLDGMLRVQLPYEGSL